MGGTYNPKADMQSNDVTVSTLFEEDNTPMFTFGAILVLLKFQFQHN